MKRWIDRLLLALGIDPRGYFALTRTFILMDLRGQHYTRATGTRPRHIVSPLFWVVGQCLTLSAVSSLLLFARVDVFFYAFVGLSVSMLVMASAVLVEFHEVVLDPRDLEVIGHRPLDARTYGAARFTNLFFYVVLMFVALNLFPLIVGAGLRDAGPWYAPAYLTASLAGNLATVGLVIGLLSLRGTSAGMEQMKELLAWTQIVLILVAGYGGQLLLRDGSHAFQLWGAFPPPWVAYLPPAWLARFVESAAVGDTGTLPVGLLLLAVAGLAVVLTVQRVASLYRPMQPLAATARRRPMPAGQVGGLGGGWSRWIARGAEERAGFWLGSTFLRRDANLKMRCLLPMSTVVAVVVLGVCSRQFANPLEVRDPRQVILSILSVYLVALAVPPIVYNLSFCKDSEAAWLLGVAPREDPAGIARGACKAVMLRIVTPLCLLLGVAAGWVWQDPSAAALHAGLAWLLSWPAALISLWLVVPDEPFSQAHAPGSTLGPIAVPLAMLSSAAMVMGGFHYLFAASAWFWAVAVLMCLLSSLLLGRQADARFRRLARSRG